MMVDLLPLIVGVVIAVLAAAAVAVVKHRRTWRDPGPWQLDGRIPRSRCAYRSRYSNGLCERPPRHRGRHNRAKGNPDPRLAVPALHISF